MPNPFTPGQTDYLEKLNDLWSMSAHLYPGSYASDATKGPRQ